MPRSYPAEETTLSSMDIAQDILECHKTLASEYTKAALESAEPSVRRAFRQMGRDCERVAFHAWEVLHEHGHYPVKSASQSECQQVEEMLESFQRGHAVPNAQPGSATRWGRGSNYGGVPERAERFEPTERGDRGDRGERSERGELPDWARARV